MPRNYGTTNVTPAATAPAVGLVGDEYYNTASKILYLSDGTVWNPVSGAGGGPAYAEVQSTPPTAASPPAIVPPMGLLWADTSTGTAPISAAYFPPQAPPPSGNNFFTDAAGTVWVSRNGSAWKMARDALKARAYRNAAWTPTNGATIALDTISFDLFAGFNVATGVYTCPIAGDYLVTAQFLAVSNAAGQGGLARISRTGVTVATAPGVVSQASANTIGSNVADVVSCAANDTLSLIMYGTPAPPTGSTGTDGTFMTVKYLGTG